MASLHRPAEPVTHDQTATSPFEGGSQATAVAIAHRIPASTASHSDCVRPTPKTVYW